jgi:hypothetical protein
VVFQDDPFAEPVTGLEVFLEDAAQHLEHDAFNSRWIADLFGSARLAEIGSNVISCSGTVIGSREAMLRYLSRMAAAIHWRRRPLGCHDQGIHNHLLRAGQLAPVQVVRNEHGRVLTMGAMKTYRQDEFGRVLNADGTVPAVVHQFDRHPRLAYDLTRRLLKIAS